MAKPYAILAGLILAIILVACGTDPSSTTTTTDPNKISLGWARAVEMVTFPDGTRCVVYRSEGGLDCDFEER